MRLIILFFLGILNFISAVSAQPKPVNIILDTDFGNDCDDAAALAILHQMVYNGEANILGIVYPMKDEWGAAAIDAVNTYYGKPNIPIGTYRGNYVYKGVHNDFYNSRLATSFPNDLRSGTNAPDAIRLYRKILASQADRSVTIVVVGPQRLVADLLKSPSDSISKLNGMDLVKRKVNQLVVMGAAYPNGHEWNIKICPDGAKVVAEQWPTRVVYSGLEIGLPIKTGERLISETPEANPVRAAYEFNPQVDEKKNRHSWDQTAVLYAVRGIRDYWSSGSGSILITDEGKNTWATESKNRLYLIQKKTPDEMKKVIEDMMVGAVKN